MAKKTDEPIETRPPVPDWLGLAGEGDALLTAFGHACDGNRIGALDDTTGGTTLDLGLWLGRVRTAIISEFGDDTGWGYEGLYAGRATRSGVEAMVAERIHWLRSL